MCCRETTTLPVLFCFVCSLIEGDGRRRVLPDFLAFVAQMLLNNSQHIQKSMGASTHVSLAVVVLGVGCSLKTTVPPLPEAGAPAWATSVHIVQYACLFTGPRELWRLPALWRDFVRVGVGKASVIEWV